MSTEVVVQSTGEAGVGWVNASGLSDEHLYAGTREIAAQLSQWVADTRSTGEASMFKRKAYIAPNNPYAQMRVARQATADDDVVGGLADTTEGLIFQGVQWESSDADEADIFNQMAGRLNLDAVMREAYRTLYTDSQVVFAAWWDLQEFKVRGRNTTKTPKEDGTVAVTRGPARRKKFHVYAPTKITVLDSLKVIPIGNRVWGQDRLAWSATEAETKAYENNINEYGEIRDATMDHLFIGRYVPDKEEKQALADLGVDPTYLLEFNPNHVWRHTLTRPSYAAFPDIRLSSVFKLLDLKQQLMEADRVNLVGAANYILLVKKGDDTHPAHPEELTNLRENFDVMARLPVIISDHRLNIEIITPKQDLVLQASKYDTIDRRIMGRLIGTLTVSGGSQRSDSTMGVARGVARLLENRRHMLKRTLEEHIARAVVDHPRNATVNGQGFTAEPNLAFTPRNVQLDSDNQIVQAVLALRTQKEISRKSLLEFFGFDQEVEAQRRELEEEQYDPIFKTTVPFSSPELNAGGTPPPQVTGAQGGRPSGGGAPPANAAKPQERNRNPRQAASKEDSDG